MLHFTTTVEPTTTQRTTTTEETTTPASKFRPGSYRCEWTQGRTEGVSEITRSDAATSKLDCFNACVEEKSQHPQIDAVSHNDYGDCICQQQTSNIDSTNVWFSACNIVKGENSRNIFC